MKLSLAKLFWQPIFPMGCHSISFYSLHKENPFFAWSLGLGWTKLGETLICTCGLVTGSQTFCCSCCFCCFLLLFILFVVQQVGSSMGLWLGLGVAQLAQAFTVTANFLFGKKRMCPCQWSNEAVSIEIYFAIQHEKLVSYQCVSQKQKEQKS